MSELQKTTSALWIASCTFTPITFLSSTKISETFEFKIESNVRDEIEERMVELQKKTTVHPDRALVSGWARMASLLLDCFVADISSCSAIFFALMLETITNKTIHFSPHCILLKMPGSQLKYCVDTVQM